MLHTRNIIDISWPITTDVTEYKDRKTVQFECSAHERGFETVRESIIRMHSHTGTHVDAPAHFLNQGGTIDHVPLSSLIGSAVVLDCMSVRENVIDALFLSQHDIRAGDIILLKTRNSVLEPNAPFEKEFVYVNQAGAQYLAEREVKAVGIDYLGIERQQPGHETHHALLSRGIPIVEGLRLGHVAAGKYFFVCLPLALVGLEAAPARAILLQAT